MELANESKTRLDEMQKKLRGLDALERRDEYQRALRGPNMVVGDGDQGRVSGRGPRGVRRMLQSLPDGIEFGVSAR